MLPLVSCVMTTYNRAPDYLHLVNEAVESFLRQDYPHRELVILNDTPGQTLALPSDEWLLGVANLQPQWVRERVRIINAPERFASMGLKYNALIQRARGSILLPWDDDDISLPWRVSQAIERLVFREGWTWRDDTKQWSITEQGYQDYFNPQRSFYLDGSGTLYSDHKHGWCHNASAFTRTAWEQVGGYDERFEMSGAEDACMDPKLKALGRTAPPLTDDPTDPPWSYIYRFGVSPIHGSAPAIGNPANFVRIGQRPIVPGRFEIRPSWRCDYVQVIQEHLMARDLKLEIDP